MYFIHNHPSGDTTPSYEDVIVLSRLIASGEELGIEVIDGLIVSCYFYIKENGKEVGRGNM